MNEDVDNFQHSLDALHAWSVRWQLPTNHMDFSVLPVNFPCPAGIYHLRRLFTEGGGMLEGFWAHMFVPR